MNILWLSQLVPYPPKGGVLQRSFHLIRELARYHTVDLIAFNQQSLMMPLFEDMEDALTVAKQELGLFCRHIAIVPIESDKNLYGKHMIALKSLFTRDPYTINWMKSNAYHEQVKHFLSENSYDVVHFDTISLVPYMVDVDDIPMVLDHHNIESHMLFRRAENETNYLMRWYFKQEGRRLDAVEKRVCPEFALNITCSEIDSERLVRLTGAGFVETVPNGVDTEYFVPDATNTQEKSLVFVGRLDWYPNIKAVRFIAYEIWPRIKSAEPGISVDIIGANPPEDICRLAENTADFNVHGFVDDVRPYINRAAIYVCPINDGGGTKLKILDALAMQKAIIAHPIACEGIAVEEGRNVLFAETGDEYVAHIKRLLADKDERVLLGVNARKLIEERYDYQSVGRNLARLFEACVKSE
jgi:sugar transferase (PEP-CTERM/EpsH1 system associated)